MSACRLVLVTGLVPVLALAQATPVERAREVAGQAREAGERRVRAAEQPVEEGPAAPAPATEIGQVAVEGAEPAPGAAAGDGDGAGHAPDRYTVKPGDTLWDLSGRFLNNPWYWPKVWSFNPEITNPHFIYPGNLLRLYPGAAEGPARLEPMVASVEEEGLEGPRELDELSRADLRKPQEYGEDDDVLVVGPYKIGYVPPKGTYARHDTFVTPAELQESGALRAAFADKVMLSIFDRAYVSFAAPANVKKGETYVIYKTDRPVRHPVTQELFGYQSTILGAGRVVAVDDKAVTVDILQAFEPIERGALLGPWQDKLVRQVQRRPNRQALTGVIIATQRESVSEIGEHHVVFLDKGKADGVEEGNVFTVLRSGDPFGRKMSGALQDQSLPDEDMGQLLVVEAQQNASTALVLRSVRELFIGDRVVMRAGQERTAQAAP